MMQHFSPSLKQVLPHRALGSGEADTEGAEPSMGMPLPPTASPVPKGAECYPWDSDLEFQRVAFSKAN